MKSPHGLFVTAALITLALPTSAQVQLQTRLSSPVVQENESFQIQLRASIEGGQAAPQNPRLSVPPGITVQGPNLAPETRVTIVNGRMMQSSGLTATWVLNAARSGKYRIGPPSMEIGGKRAEGEAKTVEVVPAGTARGRPGGIPGRVPFDPFDFFDPFRGFQRFPLPFDDAGEPEPPSHPPEFAVESAPDPLAFVTAKVSPTRVVVGQAVRFGVYAYGSQGPFQVQTATEPSRAGFIAYQDTAEPNVYEVPIGDRRFISRKIYSLVLFPIEAGTLRVGATRIGFSGRNYPPPPSATLLTRESQPLDVVVTEPPLRGRPPGYRIGDVGHYTLTAAVDPRIVRQGESVSVVAKLEGTGNVPPKLNVPLQSGVDWQEPTHIEKIDSTDGVVHGQRIFTYVVKLERAGQIDLGELTLPFYEPERRRYSLAKAALGSVQVTPNPKAANTQPAPAASEDRLRGVLDPPKTLRKLPSPAVPLTDRIGFWLILALGPMSVLTASGLLRVGAMISSRLRARRETPSEKALQEVLTARAAERRGDFLAAASAIERAVHLAIEAASGLKSRAVLRSELASVLREHGFSEELANSAVALLQETENTRFIGATSSAPELGSRAETFVRSALRIVRV